MRAISCSTWKQMKALKEQATGKRYRLKGGINFFAAYQPVASGWVSQNFANYSVGKWNRISANTCTTNPATAMTRRKKEREINGQRKLRNRGRNGKSAITNFSLECLCLGLCLDFVFDFVFVVIMSCILITLIKCHNFSFSGPDILTPPALLCGKVHFWK